MLSTSVPRTSTVRLIATLSSQPLRRRQLAGAEGGGDDRVAGQEQGQRQRRDQPHDLQRHQRRHQRAGDGGDAGPPRGRGGPSRPVLQVEEDDAAAVPDPAAGTAGRTCGPRSSGSSSSRTRPRHREEVAAQGVLGDVCGGRRRRRAVWFSCSSGSCQDPKSGSSTMSSMSGPWPPKATWPPGVSSRRASASGAAKRLRRAACAAHSASASGSESIVAPVRGRLQRPRQLRVPGPAGDRAADEDDPEPGEQRRRRRDQAVSRRRAAARRRRDEDEGEADEEELAGPVAGLPGRRSEAQQPAPRRRRAPATTKSRANGSLALPPPDLRAARRSAAASRRDRQQGHGRAQQRRRADGFGPARPGGRASAAPTRRRRSCRSPSNASLEHRGEVADGRAGGDQQPAEGGDRERKHRERPRVRLRRPSSTR